MRNLVPLTTFLCWLILSSAAVTASGENGPAPLDTLSTEELGGSREIKFFPRNGFSIASFSSAHVFISHRLLQSIIDNPETLSSKEAIYNFLKTNQETFQWVPYTPEEVSAIRKRAIGTAYYKELLLLQGTLEHVLDLIPDAEKRKPFESLLGRVKELTGFQERVSDPIKQKTPTPVVVAEVQGAKSDVPVPEPQNQISHRATLASEGTPVDVPTHEPALPNPEEERRRLEKQLDGLILEKEGFERFLLELKRWKSDAGVQDVTGRLNDVHLQIKKVQEALKRCPGRLADLSSATDHQSQIRTPAGDREIETD